MNLNPFLRSPSNSLAELSKAHRAQIKLFQDIAESNLHPQLPFRKQIASFFIKKDHAPIRVVYQIRIAQQYQVDPAKVLQSAACIEFLYAASVLHHYVHQSGNYRRQHKQFESIWNNEFGILLGDYLLSIALQQLTAQRHFLVLQTVSEATRKLARGLVLEARPDENHTLEQQALEVIRLKRASLFRAAGITAALWGNAPQQEVNALGDFCENLGMAFQLKKDQASLNSLQRFSHKLNSPLSFFPLAHVLNLASPQEIPAPIQELLHQKEKSDKQLAQLQHWFANDFVQASIQSKIEHHLKLAESAISSFPTLQNFQSLAQYNML